MSGNKAPRRLLESLSILPVIGRDSLAQIAPADTALGRPSVTARRLVDASVSDSTRRAYAGALGGSTAAGSMTRPGAARGPAAPGPDREARPAAPGAPHGANLEPDTGAILPS